MAELTGAFSARTTDDRRPARGVVWYAAWVAPATLLVAYVIAVSFVPESQLQGFHGESGPVEAVTALICAAAVVGGLVVAARLRGEPWLHRAWFVLFALGALFILLEEISYGQHYLGWESPEFFEEHNKQAETNLHNLYGDWLSSTLRKVANTMLPLTAIIAPWVFSEIEKRRLRGEPVNLPSLLRDAYAPGHWTWRLLPRWELTLWVVLAGLLSPIRKAFGFSDGVWSGSLSEVKEMMWAGALLTYALAMHHRLITARRR